MYYLIGDIHGEYTKLLNLVNKKILPNFDCEKDEFVFLGDYIDRGPDSYNVVEFLYQLSLVYKTTFIMGNHEQMLYDVLYNNQSIENYFYNGGQATIESYKEKLGDLFIPKTHNDILFSNIHHYETDIFIAVHAGVSPDCSSPEECDPFDLMWIREKFFKTQRRWKKIIVFGHTPTFFITRNNNDSRPYFDDEKNIIGIDTGAVYHGCLTCLRLPDKHIFQSC